MTLDEVINCYKVFDGTLILVGDESKQLAEWLEELKTYKEIDLEIPQHFTKEQSDWIKTYCIEKNKEFYKQALEDFEKCAIQQSSYIRTEKGCGCITVGVKTIESIKEQLMR